MKNFIKNHLLPFSLTVLTVVFLVVSSWQHYEIQPLKPIMKEILTTFSMKENKISVLAHKITSDESKLYFGYDLVSRKVQPIHLILENNTPDEYAVCPSSVDLASIQPNKIASKVMRSTIPRSIAYKIAGIIFWPFSIVGAIDSIRTLTHHKNLKKEIKSKSMRREVVAAYSTFHRILFVPMNQLEDSFKVTLIELESLKPYELLVSIDELPSS